MPKTLEAGKEALGILLDALGSLPVGLDEMLGKETHEAIEAFYANPNATIEMAEELIGAVIDCLSPLPCCWDDMVGREGARVVHEFLGGDL